MLGLHKNIQHDLRNSLLETNFLECDMSNNILKEVLRMYPLAPFLTRIMPNEALLTNHLIPANVCIV